MTDPYADYYYWSLDFPGMTRSQANELLNREKSRFGGVNGSPVDPGNFLTLHMDRETVEGLLFALKEHISHGSPDDRSAREAGIRSMVEEFENWLRFSSRGSQNNAK